MAFFEGLVKIQYPLKQGLKPVWIILELFNFFLVKIQYPLKQGLKPPHNYSAGTQRLCVKIQYPLKQGLKPIPGGWKRIPESESKFNIH